MKKQLTCLLIGLSLGASLHQAAAQGTAFTYQGRLNTGSNPANGAYDLTFSLYTAETGGTPTGSTVTDLAVGVTNGLFTAPVDFGSGVFAGTPYWLQIGVRTNGAGTFNALTPRQPLAPTPYAIFAEGANAAGLSGTIPAGDLSGTYGSALTLNNAGNSFTGSGSGLTGVNASLLGGLAPASFWQTTGNAGISPGANFLGTSDNEPLIFRSDNQVGFQLQYASSSISGLSSESGINLIGGFDGNTISSGVVGGTIAGGGYSFRLGTISGKAVNLVTGDSGAVGGGSGNTAGYFATVPGGDDNAATGNYAAVPGGYDNLAEGVYSLAAGQQAQARNQGAFVWADSQNTPFASTANDQFLIRAQGGVGIGTANPEQELSVFAGLNLDQASQNAGFLNNGNTNGYGLSFGISSGEGIASQRSGGSRATGLYGLQFYTDFGNRMTILQDGNVGIGTNGPAAALEIASGGGLGSPQLQLDQENSDYSRLRFAPSGNNPWDIAVKTVMNFYVNGANVMTLSPNGNLSIGSLTITGGSDLAEPFAFSSPDQAIPQGSVVIIDEANPGRLKLANQPYDPHVAGVVSGANGIHPGIQMRQEGRLDGGNNVALSGRVYVQADTSNGVIKPGDLLTTSSTPGHAMKVSDHARAAGAILGKAMSGLNQGNGMVLVLVSLQ